MPKLVNLFADAESYRRHLETLPDGEADVAASVTEILRAVREEGDAAVLDFTERFDGVRPETLRVSEEAIEQAVAYVDPALKDVWIQAIENIERFHLKQKETGQLEFFADGSVLGWRVTPIDRVGVYIPGGRAVYPSSLIMNAVPARIAEVPRIVVVTPPGADGLPHRDVLAVCALLDLHEVYAVGGAQAVGALAYGTETVPAVFKIVGPGNAYVAEAKRQVYGQVGIDSVAGPSEIVILATVETKVEFLARDLLSQAEHDPDARAILVTTLPELGRAVAERLEALIPDLPRTEIIQESFRGASGIVIVGSEAEGIEMVNEIAPEHLELVTSDLFDTLARIRNAGAIFLGDHTPEPVGDYFAGPNHVIPTGGRARFSSPLGVWDFVKRTTVTRYSPERLRRESDAIRLFAEREELFAHAEAVRVRTSLVETTEPAAEAVPTPKSS